MLLKYLCLLALGVSAVFASATPSRTARDVLQFNPPASSVNTALVDLKLNNIVDDAMTNAERLRKRLPPKPPRKRTRARIARAIPSGTPALQGYLLVRDENGNDIGFVGNTFNIFGEYGITQDPNQRLLVAVNVGSSGPLNILTKNGPNGNFPYLGGIKGFSSTSPNLNTGSYNYAYLGGTTRTDPDAPPASGPNSFSAATGIAEEFESAIFQVDPATYGVRAQWINTDSSKPATFIGFIEGVLVLVGDKNTFSATFGASQWITITFVPA